MPPLHGLDTARTYFDAIRDCLPTLDASPFHSVNRAGKIAHEQKTDALRASARARRAHSPSQDDRWQVPPRDHRSGLASRSQGLRRRSGSGAIRPLESKLDQLVYVKGCCGWFSARPAPDGGSIEADISE